MESLDFAQYQRATNDVVSRSCQSRESFEPLLQVLKTLSAEAENHIEQDPSDRSHIDCGPGCSSCCVVNVATLMPEGIAIARYVRQRGGDWAQRTAERLNTLWREVRGLDDDDRLFMRRPCAFLDEQGSCSIYPVRPLLCRSITSTSADNCRDALSGKVLGEETMVMMYEFQQSVYESLFSAIAAGVEATGLDGRSFQLAGLIRYLLQHPDAEQQWLAGKHLAWMDIY